MLVPLRDTQYVIYEYIYVCVYFTYRCKCTRPAVTFYPVDYAAAHGRCEWQSEEWVEPTKSDEIEIPAGSALALPRERLERTLWWTDIILRRPVDLRCARGIGLSGVA